MKGGWDPGRWVGGSEWVRWVDVNGKGGGGKGSG